MPLSGTRHPSNTSDVTDDRHKTAGLIRLPKDFFTVQLRHSRVFGPQASASHRERGFFLLEHS